MEPAKQAPQKPTDKKYGKYSRKQWILIYVVAAVIIYAAIYLIFFRKTGSTGSSGYGY